jgi:glycosyltransferase involved in cell wall biosynthesis
MNKQNFHTLSHTSNIIPRKNILVLSEIQQGGEWIATLRLVSATTKAYTNFSFSLIGFAQSFKTQLFPFFRQEIISRSTAKRPFSFFKKLLKDFLKVRRKIAEANEEKPIEVIIATDFLMAIAAKSIGLRGAKLIFSFHGIKTLPVQAFFGFDYRQTVIGFLERLSLVISEAIIVPSNFAKGFIRKRLWGFSKKGQIFLVPNFIPKGFFKRLSKNEIDLIKTKHNIPREKRLILYSGRIAKYKGLENLVKAAKRLFAAKKNIFLVICYPSSSKDLEVFGRIKNLLKDPKAKYFVRLIPDLQENRLRGLYQMADILILPSEVEFAPLSILEALASGTPCITTQKGNIDGLLSQLERRLILKSNTPQEIFQKLSLFLNFSKTELEKLNKKAAQIAKRYTSQRSERAFVKVIDYLETK